MVNKLNWSEGALALSGALGKSFSRQALQELVKRGVLTDCVLTDVGGKPIGIASREALISEYQAKVRERGAGVRPVRREPKPLRAVQERTSRVAVVDAAPTSVTAVQVRDEELPDYGESRARSEFERANLLELERKTKEGLLVERKAVENTWALLLNSSKTKLLAIPSRAKQRIPHLTLEEIDIISMLVREALEDLVVEGAE